MQVREQISSMLIDEELSQFTGEDEPMYANWLKLIQKDQVSQFAPVRLHGLSRSSVFVFVWV